VFHIITDYYVCVSHRVTRHPGNARYRQIIESRALHYKISSGLERNLVIKQTLQEWREQEPTGNFLKLDGLGLWYDIGDKMASIKVCKDLMRKASGVKVPSPRKDKHTQRHLDSWFHKEHHHPVHHQFPVPQRSVYKDTKDSLPENTIPVHGQEYVNTVDDASQNPVLFQPSEVDASTSTRREGDNVDIRLKETSNKQHVSTNGQECMMNIVEDARQQPAFIQATSERCSLLLEREKRNIRLKDMHERISNQHHFSANRIEKTSTVGGDEKEASTITSIDSEMRPLVVTKDTLISSIQGSEIETVPFSRTSVNPYKTVPKENNAQARPNERDRLSKGGSILLPPLYNPGFEETAPMAAVNPYKSPKKDTQRIKNEREDSFRTYNHFIQETSSSQSPSLQGGTETKALPTGISMTVVNPYKSPKKGTQRIKNERERSCTHTGIPNHSNLLKPKIEITTTPVQKTVVNPYKKKHHREGSNYMPSPGTGMKKATTPIPRIATHNPYKKLDSLKQRSNSSPSLLPKSGNETMTTHMTNVVVNPYKKLHQGAQKIVPEEQNDTKIYSFSEETQQEHLGGEMTLETDNSGQSLLLPRNTFDRMHEERSNSDDTAAGQISVKLESQDDDTFMDTDSTVLGRSEEGDENNPAGQRSVKLESQDDDTFMDTDSIDRSKERDVHAGWNNIGKQEGATMHDKSFSEAAHGHLLGESTLEADNSGQSVLTLPTNRLNEKRGPDSDTGIISIQTESQNDPFMADNPANSFSMNSALSTAWMTARRTLTSFVYSRFVFITNRECLNGERQLRRSERT
jgi:hypothetical protein